jgi:hypothetical protein
MFMIDAQEFANWRCQSGTSNSDRMGLRYHPMAFTEQGQSSVLNSPRAILMNIAIMRTFARLRHIVASHADMARKLDEFEQKYDAQFRDVFDALRELMNPPEPRPKRIGCGVRERRAVYRVKPRKGGKLANRRPIMRGEKVRMKTATIFVGASLALALAGRAAGASVALPAPYGPTPTPAQVKHAERAFYAFCHFTLDTFTDREWGLGTESETTFNPTEFDADQIVGAVKAGGMKGFILTCKHHDGFPQDFAVDMGVEKTVKGFTDLPRQDKTVHGMVDQYAFAVSVDGKTWTQVAEGEFGNLRANPVVQTVPCEPVKARHFKFVARHALEKNHAVVAGIGVVEH